MTKEISTYEQQALDFLKATNCEISITFLEHGKHFDDDKEERDIYSVTLKKGNRKFTFKFGNSLVKSGFYAMYGKTKIKLPSDLLNKPQSVIKQYIKWHLKSDFGSVKTDTIHFPIAPTAYDILACVEKYPVYDFADFCANYGYDEDSRKAYKTYKAVKRESENIQMLFTESELELLREIN